MQASVKSAKLEEERVPDAYLLLSQAHLVCVVHGLLLRIMPIILPFPTMHLNAIWSRRHNAVLLNKVVLMLFLGDALLLLLALKL